MFQQKETRQHARLEESPFFFLKDVLFIIIVRRSSTIQIQCIAVDKYYSWPSDVLNPYKYPSIFVYLYPLPQSLRFTPIKYSIYYVYLRRRHINQVVQVFHFAPSVVDGDVGMWINK